MRSVRRLRDPGAEARLFRSRAVVAFALAVVVLLALATRFAYLQVTRHQEYATESEANRIRARPIVPARGLIYDRAGRLLADNVPAYRLEIIPEQVEDMDATLRSLSELLQLSEEELEGFEGDRLSKRSFQAVPLKLRLSESEVAKFAVRRHEFPGVDVVPYLTRRYPYGELLGHVIGYVGRIDAQDQESLDPVRYRGATHVGKSGIERFYESRLHGQVGIERVEINAEGRTLRVLERHPAESGEHLYLSLDLELQQAAVAAFAGQSGAAVAMDPRTGEVLAMVSLPSYDPNPFVNGIGRAAYADLLNAPSRPLFNRVLLGGYEPGSTVKPFIALAGLELGLRRPSDTVFSSGAFRLPGQEREYRDWRRGGHGTIDLRESLAQSVNTYYYQLALDLGIERLTGFTSQFGFGAPTGVDLIGESAGILPTPAWKRAARNLPWYPGETVIAGIGQGFWVTTPLQLAYATAILAAGGERHPPHLLRAVQAGFDAEIVHVDVPTLEPGLSIRPDHMQAVVEGMEAVMHGPTGTARAIGEGLSYRIASKTGTAQRVSRSGDTDVDPARLAANQRNQALFIAFAPASEPTIALALVIEAGGSGTRAAAPVARQILDAWILREATP
jgi:penicillin-binding protein 2